MTVRTRSQLNSDADTYLPDNTSGAISPDDVRQRIKDLSDSAMLDEDLGSAAYADTGDFATSTQGGKADTAVQPGDLAEVATSGAYDDLSGTPTLGNAASRNVGTTAGTVAAGDDSRITGAAQKASNLSDLASAATAFGNIKQSASTSTTG